MQLKSIVQDIGISHSTLEEVFIDVTGKKQQKYVRKENRSSPYFKTERS